MNPLKISDQSRRVVGMSCILAEDKERAIFGNQGRRAVVAGHLVHVVAQQF